jgi:ABC-type sugar transport system ATPase subunit
MSMQLKLRGIRKRFGENEVLKGIDLTVNGGEVVALLGENGAGKSTLTRVISGAYQPNEGTVEINGSPVTFHKPQDSMKAGVQVIYQEFRHNLFPQLTVAENLYAGDRSGRHGRLWNNRDKMQKDADKLLKSLGMAMSPRALVRDLSVPEQQMLAIAKAIGEDASMVIFDEPTAALDKTEVEALFVQVRRLRAEGVAILYISHRLTEVFGLVDRLVVLRDGVVALETEPALSSEREVVAAMVGRSVENFYPKEQHATNQTVLQLKGLSSAGHFSDVDLLVRAGEVVGIGGVQGCGKGSLLRSLYGLLPVSGGEAQLEGVVFRPTTPRAAIASGICYLTPDRQKEGLALQQSIARNISMATLGAITSAGIVDAHAEQTGGEKMRSALDIKARSVDQHVSALSGGNQQKVLLGRWLMADPKVLLMEEPTRGVDVGAKAEIYRVINEQTSRGVAIVLVSSDLPELVEMSDRVIVMRDGRVVAELAGDDLSQESVLHHALESAAS